MTAFVRYSNFMKTCMKKFWRYLTSILRHVYTLIMLWIAKKTFSFGIGLPECLETCSNKSRFCSNRVMYSEEFDNCFTSKLYFSHEASVESTYSHKAKSTMKTSRSMNIFSHDRSASKISHVVIALNRIEIYVYSLHQSYEASGQNIWTKPKCHFPIADLCSRSYKITKKKRKSFKKKITFRITDDVLGIRKTLKFTTIIIFSGIPLLLTWNNARYNKYFLNVWNTLHCPKTEEVDEWE